MARTGAVDPLSAMQEHQLPNPRSKLNTITKWLTALGLLILGFGPTAQAQQAVLQRGYDAGVTGANLAETTLNTSNLGLNTFGLVFTLPVDDAIFAQPLYVPNVAIPGQGTHNVLYVATMSDTLYAFDADAGGAPLWSVNFASLVGATPVPMARFAFSSNKNIVGNLGILSTPVIDPSTHILYLVACTLENSTMVYRLHAVDITTGAEPYGPGMVISGSHGAATFDARYQVQRVSLVLSGQQVVFGFSAVELEGPGDYSGWVLAYDKTTLQQSGAFATVTTGNQGGGVWQSGRPPAVDSSGYVYLFSGNGYGNGYDGVNNFSESALKLDPAHGLALVDWFTPYGWSYLDDNDLDLSSSGPMLIPGTNELAGGGKTGYLYVLDTANLGKFHANVDSQIIQEEKITNGGEMHGGPVYWQRSAANGGPLLYDWGVQDNLKAYAFNGTTFGANTATEASGSAISPGGILTLSANGDQSGSGVLWATVATNGDDENYPPVPGELCAYDAADLSQELWCSTFDRSRDGYGLFAKFVPPLVVNGRVYVATWSEQVAVYGLFADQQAAPPSFTPPAGSYANAQSVVLTDSTPGALIYYTTNGTIPTTSSTRYSPGASITVGSTTTIEAFAMAIGYSSSTVATATYIINAQGGTPLSVALSSADNLYGIASTGIAPKGGGIDGRGNDYAAALLGTSVSWAGSSFTLGATGTLDAVTSATISLPAGNYATLNLLGTAVNGNQAAQTFTVTYTDGTTSSFKQSLSDWHTPQSYAGETLVLQMPYRISSTGTIDNELFNVYGYSFALNSAKTVKSITLPNNRDVVVLAMDLVPTGAAPTPAAAPTFSPAPGTYSGAQSVTLADSTSGAVIYYTTNGTTPSTNSAHYIPGTPIAVSATTTIEAIAVASGYSNSALASGTYTITAATPAATPTFSPAPGSYTSAQSVTLLDTTTGAVIYYTTNGTTPTASSARFSPSTPIPVSTTTTIEALAVASGYTNSAVASGTYTITAATPAATPTFSPAPGTYTSAQSVTLLDTTTGAVIYYTTNGTTPTASSAQFSPSTPIPVSTTTTIKALAVASGYGNSAVASGTYTITQAGTPISVALTSAENVDAIVNAGSAVKNGGIDAKGNAYDAALLGTSVSWGGATFELGAEGTTDAVSVTVVPLPAGNYSGLSILGTAVNGDQVNQSFVVTYTDGTTTTLTQSMSDWFTPQGYAGEAQVVQMAYRILSSGALGEGPFNLYGYTFSIDSTRTVKSITLPKNRDVVVLAIDLVPL
jgi:hypothetical protein